MITNQEAFDRVVRHLRKQGVRAVDRTSCKYRLGNLKCAIGCLIPDEAYSPKIEGKTIAGVLDIRPELQEFLPKDLMFCSKLQWLHDGPEDVIDWESLFTEFAEENNLTVPEKDNVCDTTTVRTD